MTNGEKIKEIFPNGVLTSINNSYYWGDDILVSKEYWNAKYKEPTTKKNLGVDTDKLIADCEKMSFDFELFGRPTKALLLDAVKNIVKDLSSVPQEPKSEWTHDHEILRAYGEGADNVLEKIRADLYKLYNDRPSDYNHRQRTELFCEVIKIIDKYKGESDIEKRKPCINYEDGCEEWAGCPCVYYKCRSEE